ncbi:hypothetical protein LINGRAHAP2_LOCUS16525, partial [Linum grandiflorum]
MRIGECIFRVQFRIMPAREGEAIALIEALRWLIELDLYQVII